MKTIVMSASTLRHEEWRWQLADNENDRGISTLRHLRKWRWHLADSEGDRGVHFTSLKKKKKNDVDN